MQGHYFALFLVGLLFFLLQYKEKKPKVEVFVYGLVAFCIVVSPMGLTLWGEWRVLLVPISLVIAFAIVKTFDYWQQKEKPKWLFFVVVIGLIALSGSVLPKQEGQRVEQGYEPELEILNYFVQEDSMEASIIVGSNDLLVQARRMNPQIRTLYGQDLWNGSLQSHTKFAYPSEVYELYDLVQSPEADPAKLVDLVLELGGNHIILPKTAIEISAEEDEKMERVEATFLEKGLRKLQENDWYVIYGLQ